MEYSAIEKILFGKRGHIDFVKSSKESEVFCDEKK